MGLPSGHAMSGPATLSGTLTSAERYFYTEALRAASTVGDHMISSVRQHPDGTTEVLTRHSGQWVRLDTGALRTALADLGKVEPGLTIACDHGYRVDNLITALALNREAGYDDCLIDALLQIAVLGTVTYDSPAGDEPHDK